MRPLLRSWFRGPVAAQSIGLVLLLDTEKFLRKRRSWLDWVVAYWGSQPLWLSESHLVCDHDFPPLN